jgi:rhamnulokinase
MDSSGSSNHLLCVAADCGASGGKMLAAGFDGERLSELQYLNFPNRPVSILQSVYNDALALYSHIVDGVSEITARIGEPATLGCDTHGCAFTLFDSFGRMAYPSYHTTDNSTLDILELLYSKVSKREIFEATGCQCGRGYSLPQLYARVRDNDSVLRYADKYMMLPDILNYFFSGTRAAERTIAGTSSMLKYTQDGWHDGLLERLGIPPALFMTLIDPGISLGRLPKAVLNETGAKSTEYMVSAGHDSAAAVTAIPGFGEGKVFVSLGTNANLGMETPAPDISEAAFLAGMKNAALGEPGRFIVYHDFAAFLIVNAVKKAWEREGTSYSYAEIEDMAKNTPSLHTYVNIECPDFQGVDIDIINALARYLKKTGQAVPSTHGEWIKCLFESIALKVKECVEHFSKNMGMPASEIVVVNGGAWYPSLVRSISDMTALPARSGMPYATLIGNVLWQLRAKNELSSLQEMRAVAERSFKMSFFEPGEGTDWDAEFERMIELGVCCR